MRNKFLSLMCVATMLVLSACSKNNEEHDKNVVILYTNDVHCAIKDNIGYDGLAYYKQQMINEGNDVYLVDAGDHLQGGAIGSLSEGKYPIQIMNEVGYDLAIPGNHEFDYGADVFVENSKMANYEYISTNLYRTEDNSRVFNATKIVELGGYKIGFVGICTPSTIRSSSPSKFQDENGNYKYSFLQDSSEAFYSNVQESVNNLVEEKVDYVIALSHLGIYGEYTSEALVNNISNLDIVIDGHSHSIVESQRILDKDGKYVTISQTGTGLTNIGKLVINKKGNISTGLISSEEITGKDERVTSFIDTIESQYQEDLNVKIGHTNFDLVINDPVTGNRLIRKQDTNMGDLLADAYVAYTNTDIGFINGGGVRAAIPTGDITYNNTMTVCPFLNTLTIAKVTGQMLKDAIENGASAYPQETGGIMIPSGFTYTIDSSIPSSIERSEDGTFIRVAGEYRVKNILINGEELVLDKYYTISSVGYNITESSDAQVIFKYAEIILADSTYDYMILASYIMSFKNGIVSDQYSNPYGQNRITII